MVFTMGHKSGAHIMRHETADNGDVLDEINDTGRGKNKRYARAGGTIDESTSGDSMIALSQHK